MGKAKSRRGFRHEHQDEDGFLLHYVRRGEFWHRIRNRLWRVAAGTVCLMDLSERVEYGNEKRLPVENWWVQFNGKEMPALIAQLRAERDPIFDHLDTRLIESSFNELLRLTQRQPPGYELKSASALLAILGELYASRARTGDLVQLVGRTAVLSEPVRQGIDYMCRFYQRTVPLKHVSDAVEQSMFHFVRRFHKEVGVPPMEYLNRFRIEQAKRLLLHGNKPVAQVGAMVGIANPTHFARLFRRYAGVTPLRFRAQSGALADRAK